MTRETARGRSPSGELNKPHCRDWVAGHCPRGEKCKYWHISPCYHWKRGRCGNGEKCIWLHEHRGDRQAAAAATETPAEAAEAAEWGSAFLTGSDGYAHCASESIERTAAPQYHEEHASCSDVGYIAQPLGQNGSPSA